MRVLHERFPAILKARIGETSGKGSTLSRNCTLDLSKCLTVFEFLGAFDFFSHRNCITIEFFFENHRSRGSDFYENADLGFLQKACNFSRNFFRAGNIPLFSGRFAVVSNSLVFRGSELLSSKYHVV